MRAFTGIQTGPRQFEFPPNIPVFDSAGRYDTSYARPSRWKTNGWSRWYFESDRMPYGPRNSFSSRR
jgi:hypothetical protein